MAMPKKEIIIWYENTEKYVKTYLMYIDIRLSISILWSLVMYLTYAKYVRIFSQQCVYSCVYDYEIKNITPINYTIRSISLR